jgi:hypothetical protein
VTRRAYDDQYVPIKNSQRTREEAEKRQAEAAERERKRAAEEKVSRQKEESVRKQRLQSLEALRAEYERDRFELNRVIRRLQAELKRLQELDDEETRKEREENSWWAYVTSPIYGKAEEPEEQKRKREVERLHRLHSKDIKEGELSQMETKLESIKDSWLDVHGRIEAEKEKEEDEARAQAAQRQEQLRKEEEARRRAAEESWNARWAQLQKEQAARAAKEAREAKEAQEARDRARRAEEARHKAATEEYYERVLREAEEARKAREARERSYQSAASSYRTSASNTSTCRHNIYWTKIDGVHTCSNCHRVQKRFAFQCPGCAVVACASCRDALKLKDRRTYTPGGHKNLYDLFTDYGSD